MSPAMRPKGLRVSELIARLSRGQGSTPAATPTSPLRAEAATLKPRPEVPSPESPPDLCDRCTQLDFDGILSVPDESQLIGGEPKELARLGRRDELHDACTLCQFFTATLSIQRLNEKPEAAAGMSYSLYPMTTNLQPKYMSNTSTSPARQVYLMLAPSPDGTPYYWSSWPATYGYVMQVLPPSERPAYRTRALGSAIDFGVVRGWMETCYWMHPSHARRPEAHNVKRLRLLDCESSELVAAEPTAKYVALSYVWGDAKLYAMADVALNSYALDGDKLPNVLRDAITVVKRLGLRYIWIDRYCIAQKSEEDMKYHLGVMHTIYLNAEVTIIAAAGTDPSFGLPGVGKCPRTVQPSIKLGKHHLVFSYASVQEIVSLSKWSTRAWVFQEALFSRRRLVFTEQQVHFECDDMQCNETVDTCPEEFSRPRELGDYFGSNNTETIERSELKAKIMEYSKRQLSYDTDVLNAMMGIFNAYESLPKPTLNFYGVPIPQKGYGDVTSEFVLSLTWRHTRPARRRPFLPSWSWAGWAGEVEYFFVTLVSKCEGVSVEDRYGRFIEFAEVIGTKMLGVADDRADAARLTRYLSLTTWTVKLRFEAMAKGEHDEREGPEYCTPQLYAKPTWPVNATKYLRLVLSRSVEDEPALYERLQQEEWDCVLPGDNLMGLKDKAPFGLVVDWAGKTAERIGCLMPAAYDSKDAAFDAYVEDTKTKRTIRLG